MSLETNKRIVKNTLLLYIRMLFSLGVSLYTSRVVLNVLGVEDFGIYNVVGGVVAMFALINASLSAASQRFITFELGKLSDQKLVETFSAVVTIHAILAIVIFVLAETIGLWFLNTRLNIAISRIDAANWTYQCSVFSFLTALLSVPYNAAIVAHEKMKAFAYIGIIEVVLKLAVVYVLVFVKIDKLKLYAVLILLVAVIVRLIYGYYCRNKFAECKFKLLWHKEIFLRIASFAGWSFIGTSSVVLMTEAVSILLNMFFTVIVNAAQGIAMQVQSAITGFVSNFMTALNPQITKSYASGDHKYMMTLVQQGARFSFYLIFFISLPLLIETESILKLWLKIVPDYTVIFVRLTLIYSIFQTLSNTLITAQLATGNIKTYQIVIGGLQMLNLPFSYVALRIGFPPQSTMVIAIAISFFCLSARIYLLRSIIKLPVAHYLQHVVLNVIVVAICSAIIPIVVYSNMKNGLPRFFCVCSLCVVSTTAVIYSIGLSKKERTLVRSKMLALGGKYGHGMF
jgi:O-antigen/teichoic acid export membrane protein